MYTVLGADAAILLAGPLIEKRFNFIHDLVTVGLAGDVQVHISIADMTVSHASNDIRSKTSLHNFDTVLTKKCNLFALHSFHIVWKLLKMSHLNFRIFGIFRQFFVLLNVTYSCNTVWPQASYFQKLAKIDYF